jgi:hypothetical protein
MAGVPHFRIHDLRSNYAARSSAGGVADESVTQLMRQGGAKAFKKAFSDEARGANQAQPEGKRSGEFWRRRSRVKGFWHSFGTVGAPNWRAAGVASRLLSDELWSHPPGLNRRPADYESAALATELGWLRMGRYARSAVENGLPADSSAMMT